MGDEIIKVLDNLAQKFGIAIDWTSDNVLPYLQDLITRYAKYICFTSIMWLIIGILIVIGFIVVMVVYFKATDYTDGIIVFLLSIGIAIGGGVIICQTIDIIEVVTIPERAIIKDIKYEMNRYYN